MTNNYRVITWTDDHGRRVSELGFHVSDLDKVLNLPFPAGAVGRVPVTEYTGIPLELDFYDEKMPCREGDQFSEIINQNLRDCEVVAIDEQTGAYLYEYTMPNGRSYLRNHHGNSVQRKKLSAKWRRILNES